MELLLRVRPTNGAARDVGVEADPDARVAALTDALAAFLGVPAAVGPPGLFREATGVTVDPQATLDRSGLVSGEALVVGTRPPRPAGRPHPEMLTDALTLVVLAGPEAGRSMVLTPGQFLVGRGPQATISIEDPTVSRRAFSLRVGADARATVVPEPDGAQDLVVNGRAPTQPVELNDESLVQTGATVLAIRRFTPARTEAQDRLGCIPYHRTPYRPSVITPRSFDALADIPARPEPRRLPLLGSLAPLAGGLALYAFSRNAEFLALMALTPITMGASWIEERRAGGRRYLRDCARFREALAARRIEVDAAVQSERIERMRAAPDATELARRAELRAVGLWPRERGAEDFLRLRLGLGEVPSRVSAPIASEGDRELRDEARAALAGHDRLGSVPIVAALAELGTLALHGPDDLVERVAASLVLQAATLHSPEDLIVFAALGPKKALAHQVNWLPHTRSLSSPLATRHVVTATESGQALCSQLVAVANRRSAARDDGTDRRWPWLLVVLDETLDIDAAVVARLLDKAPSAGISVVWLARSDARIPRQAEAVLRCLPSHQGPSELWFRNPLEPVTALELEPIPPEITDPAMRALAPMRDAGASNVTTAIPRVVPLLAALGEDERVPPGEVVGHLAQRIQGHWLADTGYNLEAPLGLTAAGAMSIDLVADGPHVLIGGTSGSGKSELLVALVSGLIARHSPERLNLLFVDYKGGAASSVFRAAPHTVGYVTNLNGDLANRALVSLRAELNRRMHLLEGRAKDLGEMLDLYPNDAPASLVIVVDEFATLVKEIPDFVPGIVDVAQRGRSLGIHLVLATQRPTGAVNENILANTNARLCLRMIDAAESSAIIGTPDAATIPVPLRGRGFARLGPSELIAFQAAYGGTPLDVGGTAEVHVEDFGAGRQPSRRRSRGHGAVPAAASGTQLDALLNAVRQSSTALNLGKPRAPWLDELPPLVPVDAVLKDYAQPAGRWVPPLGRYDDPARQRQDWVTIDLEEGGGLLVFGAGASGKTTLLRTLAAVGVAAPPPEGVAIVALDFATRALRCLEPLPECAAVALGDDLEAVTRELGLLQLEVARRRSLLAGTESLSAHVAAGGLDLPRVLVLVDGYSAMRDVFTGEGATSAMHGWMDRFHRIVAEGRQVGVHAVITADRPGAIAPVLSSLISRRLILRQVDERVLIELGVPSARARGLELGPGRGLLDAGLLIQIACVSNPATDGAAQAAAIAALSRGRRRELPAQLRSSALQEVEALPSGVIPSGASSGNRLAAVLGVADVTHDPVVVDLADGHLVVAGPAKSGRTSALRAILASLVGSGADVYVAGPSSSPLRREHLRCASAFGDAEVAALAAELLQLASAYPEVPRLLVLDDADRLLEDPAVSAVLDPIRRCDPVRVVAAVETATLTTYVPSALLQQMKNGRRRLLLQPVDAGEIQGTLGVRFPLRPGLTMPPGRGVLQAGRSPLVVQVGVPEVHLEPPAVAERPAVRVPR